MDRAERRRRSKVKERSRVEDMKDWARGDEWWDGYRWVPMWKQRFLKQAKHKHPFGGHTRRLAEAYPGRKDKKDLNRDFSDGDS